MVGKHTCYKILGRKEGVGKDQLRPVVAGKTVKQEE